jgi:hypothetical protein
MRITQGAWIESAVIVGLGRQAIFGSRLHPDSPLLCFLFIDISLSLQLCLVTELSTQSAVIRHLEVGWMNLL